MPVRPACARPAPSSIGKTHHARVRPQAADRQPAVRRHAQPVGSLPHAQAARREAPPRRSPLARAAGARHRRRRLHPPARRVLRHRRPQPTLGRVPHVHQADLFSSDVLHRPDGAERGGSRRLLRRDRRLRSGDPYSRPEPRDDPRDVAVRGCDGLGWLPGVGNPLVDPEVLASCEAAGAPSGAPGRPRRDRGRGLRALRAHLPWSSLRADWPRASARTWRRSATRWRAACASRSTRRPVVRRSDWANALGPADHGVPPRARALPRASTSCSPRPSAGPRSPSDHDPYEPITIAGENAGIDPRRLVSLSRPFNLSGHPAVSLPCGLVIGRAARSACRSSARGTRDRRVPRPGRAPRARAPVRAPDAPLTHPSFGGTSCRSRPNGLPGPAQLRHRRRDDVDRARPQNAERPIVMSQGAYGWKVGMPRILDLLARYGLRVTFFVPGLVMEQRPAHGRGDPEGRPRDRASLLVARLDRQPDARAGARGDGRGIDIIKRMTGRKPVGYRSPAAEFSPHTLRMLAEYGFGYSSNYFDDDSPYLHRIDGKLTDIVEFPFAVGAGRRAVLPVLDHAARAHHAGAIGGVRGVAPRVRRPLPRGPATSASPCTRRSSAGRRASRCSRS